MANMQTISALWTLFLARVSSFKFFFFSLRRKTFQVLDKAFLPLYFFNPVSHFFLLLRLFIVRFILRPLPPFLFYFFTLIFSCILGGVAIAGYHYFFLCPDLNLFFSFFDRSFFHEVELFALFPFFLFSLPVSYVGHLLYQCYDYLWWDWFPFSVWVGQWIKYLFLRYTIGWIRFIPISGHLWLFFFGLFRGRFEPLETIVFWFFVAVVFPIGALIVIYHTFTGEERIYNRLYIRFFKYSYLFYVLYRSLPFFLRAPFQFTFFFLRRFFSFLWKIAFPWSLSLLGSFRGRHLFPIPWYLFPLAFFLIPLRSLWSVFLFLYRSVSAVVLSSLSFLMTAPGVFFPLRWLRSPFPGVGAKSFSLPLSSFLKSPVSGLRAYFTTFFGNFFGNRRSWIDFFFQGFRTRFSALSEFFDLFGQRIWATLRLSPYYVLYFFLELLLRPLDRLYLHWVSRYGFRRRTLRRAGVLMQRKFYPLIKKEWDLVEPDLYFDPWFIEKPRSFYMLLLCSLTWPSCSVRTPHFLLDSEINYVLIDDNPDTWPGAYKEEVRRLFRLLSGKTRLLDRVYRPRTFRELYHYRRACLGSEYDKKRLASLLRAHPPFFWPECLRSDYEPSEDYIDPWFLQESDLEDDGRGAPEDNTPRR